MKENKIKHLSLAEEVYHRLLDQIVKGKLAEGSKLTEEKICADLGVSRTPAREALMLLFRDKLIERIPRRGCFVRNFDHEEIKELFECRKMLECLALDKAFEHLPEQDLEKLKHKLEKASTNKKKSLLLDEKMHELFICNCPNRHLRDIVRQTIKRTQPLRSLRTFDANDSGSINNERLEIVNALLEKDKEKAINLLGSHICKGSAIIEEKEKMRK